MACEQWKMDGWKNVKTFFLKDMQFHVLDEAALLTLISVSP